MPTRTAVLAASLALLLSSSPSESRGLRRATESCADLGRSFEDRPTARDEQQLEVPASQGGTLSLRPDTNGGVAVHGGAGPGYAITLCRVASGGTQAEAEARLREIEASVSGGEVAVSGPRGGHWAGFLLVSAPPGARLDVEVRNGPISFRDLEGTIAARATNGPISLHQVSGSVDASTQNGPIAVEGGSGDYTLRANNGPIALQLPGDHWDGKLDGSTRNGPLSVELPPSFASGLRIETSSWAPARCRATVCDGARWDKSGRTHVLEIGAGAPSVTLSTINGPLAVSDSGS